MLRSGFIGPSSKKESVKIFFCSTKTFIIYLYTDPLLYSVHFWLIAYYYGTGYQQFTATARTCRLQYCIIIIPVFPGSLNRVYQPPSLLPFLRFLLRRPPLPIVVIVIVVAGKERPRLRTTEPKNTHTSSRAL